ncbi:MAG: hypothetical protein QOJ73_3981 [Streptosporangiaceae bacterium]|jgi:hypothetical protein|nr:hypothetical protein [Streptosporangiaceae bacterium]
MTRTLWRRAWAPVLAVAASLGLAMATSPAALAATSSTYYFKYFATSGTISPWYTNDSSWGVNAPSGTGFVAMVSGEDWGTWSPVHAIPKRLSAVGSGNTTWFSQSASPASGAGYDATYDIFIDPTAAPTNRNSIDEIMIWVGYRYNQPLSNSYNSAGEAVPYATNVSLGGNSYNVYLYNWPGGGYTMTYLNPASPGWFSGSLTPFFSYGESHGWYPSSDYLNSVMAGWEFGHGSYTAHSWGVSGF